MRVLVSLCLVALMGTAAIAGPVGDLSFFGVVDPQPNFNILAESRAVISPDGRFAFIASPGEVAAFDSEVISARIERGVATIVSRLPQGTNRISQPVLSPDGRRLAVTGATGRVYFFEVNPLTGALTQTGDIFAGVGISGDHRPVFSADGRVLYYGNSNSPGELFTLDADPAGGIDTSPLDSITLGSSLEAFRMAVSGDGTTLVVAALKRSGLNDDSLFIYDIAAGTGLLTERGQYMANVDLGWNEFTNPVVSFDGIDAFVVDAPNQQVLQIDIEFPAPSVIGQAPTLGSPQTLTLGEQDNVLLNVCANGVAVFSIDDGTPTARGSFQPPGVVFSSENNAVLNAEGTLGAVASLAEERIYTFKTFPSGVTTALLDTFPAQQNPAGIAGGFDLRRLLVLNTNPDAVDEIATVLEVETPDGYPVRVTALSTDLTYGPTNTPVVMPNGVAVHATSSDPMVTFPVFASDEVQLDPALVRQPFQGLDLVVSANGSTLAGCNATQVFIHADPFGNSASGTFVEPTANYTNVRMAISVDGNFLYVPDPGTERVFVIDTTTTGTFDSGSAGVQSFDLPGSSGATIATLSPDGAQLSIALATSNQVLTFDVDGGTGALSNSRTQDIPFTMAPTNNPIFVSATRGAIAAGSSTYLYDTTQSSTTPLDQLVMGTALGTLAPVPNASRFLALDGGLGQASAVELTASDSLEITGFIDGLNLGVTSWASVAPDGIAVIPNAVLPGGGIVTFDTERFGATDQPLGRDVTGFTTHVDLDAEGIMAASLNHTNNFAQVHGISRGAPPRLRRAVLFENTVNGIGEQGEQLLLGFDRPVIPSEFFPIADSYFNLTGGGTIGGFAALAPDVTANFNQVILILGFGTNGIVAAGDTVGIDIAAGAPVGLFQAIGDGVPHIDLGLPGIDDAGVDIVSPMGSVTDNFTPGLGLLLQLPQSNDFAFSRHSLNIQANSVGGAASFTMSPPPLGSLPPGVINAVQISTNALNTASLFNPPAVLTLEYDPALFNNGQGLFEYLGVNIVQILDLGDGPQAFVIPGPFSINTVTNTVSAEISNFDPTGLGGRAINQGGGGAGTFATIPVNPVDERTIYLTGGGGGDVAPAQVVVLTSGDDSAYTQHKIEFPGYTETTESDPSRLEVTIRTPTLYERVSMTGGQSFPTQSGSLFVIETTDAMGTSISFTDAVNITVEFIEREDARETDTIDFDSALGHPSQMRIVHDLTDGAGVDFGILGGTRMGSLVTMGGHAPLTGASGAATLGSVIDTSAPIEGVEVEDIVNHILGIATLSMSDEAIVDVREPLGTIDAADLVYFILNNP